MKDSQDAITHAKGVIAAKALDGPVPQKYVNAALRLLERNGLIPRARMSAQEAWEHLPRE